MTIAVIIPVWNDAATLPAAIASALEPNVASRRSLDVVVVDAGSDDGSADMARAAGARVLASPVRQRAAQMNLGAAAVTGSDVLLFLHADTSLPAGWAAAIGAAFARNPQLAGGAFRRRFVPGSWFLRLTCLAADLRGRWWGWFLGDQAMFVRREIFRDLGGFASVPVCEDLDFARRLARRGHVQLLREVVRTSDRRFRLRGPLRQTLADIATVRRFLRGE